MDTKINYYDKIVGTTMTNIIVSTIEKGGLVLDNFNPNNMDHLYFFEIALMTAQIQGKPFYVNLGIFDYLLLERKNWKRRKAFKRYSKKVTAGKTDVQFLLDYMTEQLNLEKGVFEVIYNEYYKS